MTRRARVAISIAGVFVVVASAGLLASLVQGSESTDISADRTDVAGGEVSVCTSDDGCLGDIAFAPATTALAATGTEEPNVLIAMSLKALGDDRRVSSAQLSEPPKQEATRGGDWLDVTVAETPSSPRDEVIDHWQAELLAASLRESLVGAGVFLDGATVRNPSGETLWTIRMLRKKLGQAFPRSNEAGYPDEVVHTAESLGLKVTRTKVVELPGIQPALIIEGSVDVSSGGTLDRLSAALGKPNSYEAALLLISTLNGKPHAALGAVNRLGSGGWWEDGQGEQAGATTA